MALLFLPPNILDVDALGLNKAQYVLLGVLQTEHFVIAEFETCKNPLLSKFSLKQSTVACNLLLLLKSIANFVQGKNLKS